MEIGIGRREFIATLGGIAAWPLAVRAQQPAMPVVGFLSGRSLASDTHLVKAFRDGLGEADYVEGRNVAIEFRWAEGKSEQLPALAAELIADRVAVIFAGAADIHIRELNAALSTIPVVYATAGDPVELGLVTSLARPGGNATGFSMLSAALWPKRLELLRELIGQTGVVAVLVDPGNATAALATKDLEAAAHAIGQQIVLVNAGAESELDAIFTTIAREHAGALLVPDDVLFINQRDRLIALAALHAVPAMYGRREFPASGGLMSYGASAIEQYRQCGLYAGRILAGARPGDLPFLQPTRFELVINLKAAKVLGLKVPQTLLVAADEVIE